MNEEVRKAVDEFNAYMPRVGVEYPGGEDAWEIIRQALRDQEAEIATRRANYDALVIRLGEVTARLEAADGLLRECLSVMELHPATHARITTHLKAADHV